jgi:hypothetical protein
VRDVSAPEGIRPAERDLAAPRIRRHVSEDVSSLEAARQRRNRNDRALRAVVSVHEDIGASQTRPARVKTSPRMPDFLTCKLHGRALAVMLCEDDGFVRDDRGRFTERWMIGWHDGVRYKVRVH